MKTKKRLSLYIHIPFCVQKCHYCDFLSFRSGVEQRAAYVKSLCQEIRAQADIMNEYEVGTIFFGGGTPSILDEEQITTIMNCLKEMVSISDDAEISIEMNPGSVTKEKLKTYQALGINRLSIGLQSTHDEELKLLGRIHTYQQFVKNYEWARELGFKNINIDIMSALPYQTVESYQETLIKVLALKPTHISSYSLIIEEGTKFYDDEELLYHLPSEKDDRLMYEMTRDLFSQNGYQRYEISNYALDGYECQHNNVYWTLDEYLGLGLNASSFFQGARFRNTDVMEDYLLNPAIPITDRDEYEIVSRAHLMEEFMFLGLRRGVGIDLSEFQLRFQTSIEAIYGQVIETFMQQNLLYIEDNRLKLTTKGIDLSNQVFSEFIQ